MTDIENVRQSKVGDRVALFGQKRKYKVMSRSERFVILSKPCFGKALYTIFDFEDKWIAPDNLVFCDYDYNTKEDAEEALKDLQKGEIELSRRHGISFDDYSAKYN